MIPLNGNKTLLLTTLIITIVALIAGVALLINTQQSPVPPSDKLTVATTIFPLADIISNIGGEHVHVVQLLPAGASPHSYNLSPQQLSDVRSAQALFMIGHNLDNWAADAVTRISDIPAVTVDANVELREFGEEDTDHHEDDGHGHVEGGTDPHYWLSVPNAVGIATQITSALSELDPAHAEDFQNNAADYIAELASLEAELQALASAAPQKEFLASHDAWSYLAHQYGFELLATYEPVEGREPSINDIRRLQDLVQEHNIQTFYTEPAEHSSSAIRLFQDNLGLTVKTLDDIGGIPPRDSYISLMRENIKALSQ